MTTATTAWNSHAPQQVSLALDIGGTTLKGAAVDAAGRTLITQTIPTSHPGKGVMHRALAVLRALKAESLQRGLHPVGIGVGTPGLVNSTTGVVEYASSLGWTTMPVANLLAAEFSLPVLISHDARAAGLAEARLLPPAPGQNSVFVAIGTGVGAALITDGTVITGATHSAGELGHIPVIPGGETCTCGQHGCLEAYFSGAGLVRRYRSQGGDLATTAADIASGQAGETGARIWDEGIQALALALTTVTLLTDPGTIIIGGGLSEAGDKLLHPLEQTMSSLLAWRRPPALKRSLLGPRAGQIGAAILGFQAAGSPDTGTHWSPGDAGNGSELALGEDTSLQLTLDLRKHQGHP
ncbi:ROK family protein [Pseudarthrobacter sp. NPDC058329]|uniref:ROK family protein n=1 Tax=Pseudarthrobacter sp. NPDC058329 TaxID=3346448 RepID=UPI0036DDA6F0